MNPQELYEAYMSVYESDDRREMRRLASQERQAEKKAEQDFRKNTPVGGKKSGPKLSATKMSKKEGENFAKQTMNDAEYIAKKAKGHTVGNPFPEEFDYFDQVLSELIDAGYTAEEALEYMVQEASPIYSRGGEQRRTQTPRQIGVKSAPHNIPKGGTTISDRDPQGKRLFTGDQDRGKGNKAARRAAALKNEEFKFWVDALVEEGYDLSEYTWDEMLDIYEAEGSYGQTPRARAAMGKLAVSRMNKPASEYSKRGEKTTKVNAATRHTRRQDRLASGNNRYGSRGPMDQSRRNWSRGADDYGHSGYDGDGYGGSVTKNPKKLRKQKAMGEISKENYNNHRASEEFVGESQYARNNPEKYEREQRKSQSSRERRMNDPKTGINSKAFNDFYNAQMGRKKKASEETVHEQQLPANTTPQAKWNKGQKLSDPRAQKIYDRMTGPNSVKLPPA
jgi:hypothetical protein